MEFQVKGSFAYKAAKKVQVGDTVVLRAEPKNKQDENAIEILTESGKRIGYVPRELTGEFTELPAKARVIADNIPDTAKIELTDNLLRNAARRANEHHLTCGRCWHEVLKDDIDSENPPEHFPMERLCKNCQSAVISIIKDGIIEDAQRNRFFTVAII